MSRTDEPSSGNYSLRVDARGVLVEVRAQATVELFEEVLQAIRRHPLFRRDMPAVWDMTQSEGMGRLRRAEMARMVLMSRRTRGADVSYRVALVASRDVDYGVGRMLEGSHEGRGTLEFGIFRTRDEAEAWAYGPSDSENA